MGTHGLVAYEDKPVATLKAYYSGPIPPTMRPSPQMTRLAPCERPHMHFTIRPFLRFLVRCFITSDGLGYRWAAGLVLLVLLMSGCAEWTIPSCKGSPFNTPCVGPCTVDAEPATRNFTQVTIPRAVVIHDQSGTLHCQQIKP